MNITELIKKWCEEKSIAYSHSELTKSTNDDAKAEAFKVDESFKLYMADEQSHGRGRGSNEWLASKNSSLLSSWSFKVDKAPQPIATPLIGLCLFNSVQKLWPNCAWSLKAPNDLYLERKKIAGLLVETQTQGDKFRLIIGLGFNFLNSPEELSDIATSLNSEDGLANDLNETDISSFLNELYSSLKSTLESLSNNSLDQESCEQLLVALNANPNKESRFIEVTPEGSLVTENETIPWENL